MPPVRSRHRRGSKDAWHLGRQYGLNKAGTRSRVRCVGGTKRPQICIEDIDHAPTAGIPMCARLLPQQCPGTRGGPTGHTEPLSGTRESQPT